MTEHDTDDVVERFRPTNGWFSGFVGLGTALVILVLALMAGDTGRPLGVAIGAALGGLLAWVALLRPALWATQRDLALRGMYHTDFVPLAAIDKVAVSQVLAVSAGGKRYVSPTIGYTARQTVKGKMNPRSDTGKVASEVDTHQIFVEHRILHLAQTSRDQLGITKGSPEQAALAADVRRTYAWPEIAGTALCLLAFVVWIIV